jgi:hypothetical protein
MEHAGQFAASGRDGDNPATSAGSGDSAPDSGASCEPWELQPSAPAPEQTHVPDAREIDRRLRDLFTERVRHDVLLAEHVRLVALDRGYRDQGFPSLEAYAFERFGLSVSTLYVLLALGRRIEALPPLRNLLLTGRLTPAQASLLGRAASRVTLPAWVERARRVTLRRLEDEVLFWIHLKETRPDVWSKLDGLPLPEGIALAPGTPPRLQASAPPEAASFLSALEADEAATPLPGRFTAIQMLVEPEVREMWDEALADLRSRVRNDLAEWEALALVLREFWREWDNAETRRQRRRHPVLERDGWRCSVPVCRSVGTGNLQVHHLEFRSAGGSNDHHNLTSMCSAHHLGLLHHGLMRVTGEAPDALRWKLGIKNGLPAFMEIHGEALETKTAPR